MGLLSLIYWISSGAFGQRQGLIDSTLNQPLAPRNLFLSFWFVFLISLLQDDIIWARNGNPSICIQRGSMKKQLQCLLEWVWGLTMFQTWEVSCSVLSGCNSWCTWRERLRYISGLNFPKLHHHLAGNHHCRGPRTLAVPKQGQLKLLLHRKTFHRCTANQF